MKRRIIWIFAIAAIAVLIGFSIWQRVSSRRIATVGRGAAPVAVAAPRRGEIVRTLSYTGTLAPDTVVTLTPKSAGRVEKVLVREGDSVREGQLLARMEDDVVSLQRDQAGAVLAAAQAQLEKAQRGVRPEELANAQASLSQAETDFSTAEDGYQRAARLFKEGTIAKTKMEDAEKQYTSARTQLENARRNVQMMQKGAGDEEQRMAQAGMSSAQAQYDLAQLQLDFTRISSPIAGRVTKVLVDEGNMASPTTPLLVVTRDDPMIVRVALPESHYGEFRERSGAMEARVSLEAVPASAPFAGRISSIGQTVDPASRTFTVEVSLDNRMGLLRAGMYAKVGFLVERASGALLVPATALVTRGGKIGVFVVDGSGTAALARFHEVRLGLQDAEKAQVIEGIGEADSIVTEGNAFLEDGQAVSVGG